MKIYEERMTAESDEDLVVFLIGMRINRWWKPQRWLPTAMAMPRMLNELTEHPELGFLGGESWFGRTTIMVQYWRSHRELYAYAHDRENQHLPAWKDFNRRLGNDGDVGVWHESYEVRRSGIGTLYANMPAFGLGKVRGLLPARAAA